MNDKKKQQELDSFVGREEAIRIGNWHPDLYTQMSHSLSEIQKEEQNILNDIQELYANQGDFILSHILDNIYQSFIFEFMDGDGNLEDGEEEVVITREKLFLFSSDLYSKIDAIKHLNSIYGRFDRIDTFKSRVDLAKKGVLI